MADQILILQVRDNTLTRRDIGVVTNTPGEYAARVKDPDAITVLSTIAATDFATETTVSTLLTNTQLRASAVPVSISGAVPVTGPLTDAQLRASAVPVTFGGTVTVQATDLDIRDLVFATDKVDASGSSVSVSNFPATQPVSGTVTANQGTSPWIVSGTVAVSNFPATQPISGTVAISQTGTDNNVDANITNASLAVTGPLTEVQLRATPVDVLGPLTNTELRASPIDVNLSSGDIQIGAVELKDATTADRASISAAGALKVDGSAVTQPISGTVTATNAANYAEDSAHTTGDTGTFVLGVRNEGSATFSGLDGDYTPIAVDRSGRIYVTTHSSNPVTVRGAFLEDAGHFSADPGHFVLGVRNDADAVLTNADQDYSAFAVDSAGRTKIAPLPAGTSNIGDVDILSNVLSATTTLQNAEVAPTADGVPLPVSNYASAAIHVIALGGAASVVFEGRSSSADSYSPVNVEYVSEATDLLPVSRVSSAFSGLNGSYLFFASVAGLSDLRVRITANAGSVTVRANASPATYAPRTVKVDAFDRRQGIWTDNTAVSESATQGPLIMGYDSGATRVQAIKVDAAGELQIDVLTLPALPAGSNNIGDVDVLTLPAAVPAKAASATLANVSDTASSTTLQASNSSRIGWTCFNDSTSALFIKFGATASATSFNVKLAAGAYYEMPIPIYTGTIDGIWTADAAGAARVMELT